MQPEIPEYSYELLGEGQNISAAKYRSDSLDMTVESLEPNIDILIKITVLLTDFPANLTHQRHYFMTPCGGAYDKKVGNMKENLLFAEEENDYSCEKNLRDAPATF